MRKISFTIVHLAKMPSFDAVLKSTDINLNNTFLNYNHIIMLSNFHIRNWTKSIKSAKTCKFLYFIFSAELTHMSWCAGKFYMEKYARSK